MGVQNSPSLLAVYPLQSTELPNNCLLSDGLENYNLGLLNLKTLSYYQGFIYDFSKRGGKSSAPPPPPPTYSANHHNTPKNASKSDKKAKISGYECSNDLKLQDKTEKGVDFLVPRPSCTFVYPQQQLL